MLALLKDFMIGSSSSPAQTIPASPGNLVPTNLDPLFTPTTSLPVSTIISFLDISSPATSILPPTPPTSLVSPLPQPSCMLSTPSTSLSHSIIPFNLSPYSSSSTFIIDLTNTSSLPSLTTDPALSSLRTNLSRHPFIDILPGATSEVFMAPQPLNFVPPPPSTSVFTIVILSSIN